MFQSLSLTESTIVQTTGFEIVLTPERLSLLRLPTGKLVACDPLAMPETEAFIDDLPKGNFPIYAIRADLRDETRLAFMVVEFTTEKVAEWDMLVVPGEEIDWRPTQRTGFLVDTCYAALMDESCANLLVDRFVHAHKDLELSDENTELEKLLLSGLRKPKKKGAFPFVDFPIDDYSLFAFWTDPGAHAGYIGRDSKGDVARIMFDFSAVQFVISPKGFIFR